MMIQSKSLLLFLFLENICVSVEFSSRREVRSESERKREASGEYL